MGPQPRGRAPIVSGVHLTAKVATMVIARTRRKGFRVGNLWLAGSLKVIGWPTFEWRCKMRSWLWPAI
jgi:hypothetical protein